VVGTLFGPNVPMLMSALTVLVDIIKKWEEI
jgi:hypothetical protein